MTAQSIRAPLAEAVAGLAPPDRDVLLLIAWEQLSYDEVARALNRTTSCPPSGPRSTGSWPPRRAHRRAHVRDVSGRLGIGVVWHFYGSTAMNIFDPRTYAYLGMTTWGEQGQLGDALVQTAIVDRAGEMP